MLAVGTTVALALDFWHQAGLWCFAKEAVYEIWERVGMTRAPRCEPDTSCYSYTNCLIHTQEFSLLLSSVNFISCPSQLVYQLGHV